MRIQRVVTHFTANYSDTYPPAMYAPVNFRASSKSLSTRQSLTSTYRPLASRILTPRSLSVVPLPRPRPRMVQARLPSGRRPSPSSSVVFRTTCLSRSSMRTSPRIPSLQALASPSSLLVCPPSTRPSGTQSMIRRTSRLVRLLSL